MPQAEHAALSAQAAAAWERPASLPPGVWARFLSTVRHHDDGWIQAEQAPILDAAGRPYDFKSAPTTYHVEVWRRSIDLAQREDPYRALLIAQHARWLYTRFNHQTDPADARLVVHFIDELAQRIDQAIRALEGSHSDDRAAVGPFNLMIARRLLAFFDALSLMLAGGLPWSEETEPVAFGQSRATLTLTRAAADPPVGRVSPWPFAQPQVELIVPAAELPAQPFASSQAFAAALAQAPKRTTRWTLRKRLEA